MGMDALTNSFSGLNTGSQLDSLGLGISPSTDQFPNDLNDDLFSRNRLNDLSMSQLFNSQRNSIDRSMLNSLDNGFGGNNFLQNNSVLQNMLNLNYLFENQNHLFLVSVIHSVEKWSKRVSF